MPLATKIRNLLRNLFRRKQVEQDLNDELQAYVDEMAARGAGLTELGDIDRIKDLVRQQRVGYRSLRTASAFVVVALVAFVSGASAAVGAMRWSTPAVPTPIAEKTPQKESNKVVRWETLQGRLVDQTTGEPIPNAEVGLQPSPTARRYTYTDKDGRFAFLDPPGQGYKLDAGEQQWGISGLQPLDHSLGRPLDPSVEFYLFPPSHVVVKSKEGSLVEGRREVMHGVVWLKELKKTRPETIEYRAYRYDSSIVELTIDKSIGFDTAQVVRFSNTRRP
jgi:hypothetical protein